MSASLHFVTNPNRSAPADHRTDALTGLNSLVRDHLRAALACLDTPERPDLGGASLRLYYAAECATMVYDLIDPVVLALRDFRRVVDALTRTQETTGFALDLALVDCLTALRKATTSLPIKSRLGLAA